uniref:AGC-kinase C-terminal domain-containing protein n=1 Tax=Romanomermis culicivorax TaxID=13658 RepID=A0A915HU39_ROMCU
MTVFNAHQLPEYLKCPQKQDKSAFNCTSHFGTDDFVTPKNSTVCMQNSSDAKVDFPDPLDPTMANVERAGTAKFKFFSSDVSFDSLL